MTQRFKDAVKECVADGELTNDEKELLKKVAKEEGINETDAEVYITAELKRKKRSTEEKKSSSDSDWGSTLKTVGEVIVTVGGFGLTVLTAMGKIGPGSNNNKS